MDNQQDEGRDADGGDMKYPCGGSGVIVGDFLFSIEHHLPYGKCTNKFASKCDYESLQHMVINLQEMFLLIYLGQRWVVIVDAVAAAVNEIQRRKRI